MRKLVKVEKGIRCWFTGTFDRIAPVYIRERGRCWFVVINNIVDEYGNSPCNCAYFADIKGFQELNLQQGDTITFRARYTICQNATEALYGFRNSNDGLYYRLMNPTKITKLFSPVKSLIVQPNNCKIKITPTRR